MKAWLEFCSELGKTLNLMVIHHLRGADVFQVKSAYEPIVSHQAGAYRGFYSMK